MVGQSAPLCVFCQKRPVVPKWRPFCSDRCQVRDLAQWSEGNYRVAGESAGAMTNDEITDHERDPDSHG